MCGGSRNAPNARRRLECVQQRLQGWDPRVGSEGGIRVGSEWDLRVGSEWDLRWDRLEAHLGGLDPGWVQSRAISRHVARRWQREGEIMRHHQIHEPFK